jgi:hypothetical protein
LVSEEGRHLGIKGLGGVLGPDTLGYQAVEVAVLEQETQMEVAVGRSVQQRKMLAGRSMHVGTFIRHLKQKSKELRN